MTDVRKDPVCGQSQNVGRTCDQSTDAGHRDVDGEGSLKRHIVEADLNPRERERLSKRAPSYRTFQGSEAHDYAKAGPSSLAETFRSFMRSTPSSVVIVIAGYNKNKLDEEASGMLAASFAPVTLYPEPCVSFNIKLPSSTYDKMVRTERFTIIAPENAMLSAEFAKPGRKHPTIKDILAKSRGYPDKHSGVLWWAHCQLLKRLHVGDHVVVVGTVREVGKPRSPQRSNVMIYAGGQYHEIGPPIHPHDDAFHIKGTLHKKGLQEEDGGSITQEARRATKSPQDRARKVRALMIQQTRQEKRLRDQKDAPGSPVLSVVQQEPSQESVRSFRHEVGSAVDELPSTATEKPIKKFGKPPAIEEGSIVNDPSSTFKVLSEVPHRSLPFEEEIAKINHRLAAIEELLQELVTSQRNEGERAMIAQPRAAIEKPLQGPTSLASKGTMATVDHLPLAVEIQYYAVYLMYLQQLIYHMETQAGYASTKFQTGDGAAAEADLVWKIFRSQSDKPTVDSRQYRLWLKRKFHLKRSEVDRIWYQTYDVLRSLRRSLRQAKWISKLKLKNRAVATSLQPSQADFSRNNTQKQAAEAATKIIHPALIERRPTSAEAQGLNLRYLFSGSYQTDRPPIQHSVEDWPSLDNNHIGETISNVIAAKQGSDPSSVEKGHSEAFETETSQAPRRPAKLSKEMEGLYNTFSRWMQESPTISETSAEEERHSFEEDHSMNAGVDWEGPSSGQDHASTLGDTQPTLEGMDSDSEPWAKTPAELSPKETDVERK